MNKIVNWTIGSFFRTIGRIIAYIGIGIVITYILSNSNINWGGITDLFFDKVSAATFERPSWSPMWYDRNHTNQVSTNGNYAVITTQFSTQTGVNTIKDIYFNEINTADLAGGTIEFQLFFEFPFVYTTATSTVYGSDYCDRWDWASIDSYNNVIKWTCSHLSESQNSQISDREYLTPYSYLVATMWNSTDTAYSVCDLQGQRLSCPISSSMQIVDRITLQYKSYLNSSYTGNYNINIFLDKSLYKSDGTIISNAINSQTQQQQQQHQEMMDDNTTQAESEASDFFEDFTAPDIGGLGAIITAPLNTIRSLLNSSCTNLVLPLPFVNENITLPCMTSIYTEHFGAFFSIYQTIILAIIAYRCIRSIFFDIHGFTNPNDDRIEVMDL